MMINKLVSLTLRLWGIYIKFILSYSFNQCLVGISWETLPIITVHSEDKSEMQFMDAITINLVIINFYFIVAKIKKEESDCE